MNNVFITITMKKVRAVARHKLILVFLMLCIMVLILSPWADVPSPVPQVAPMLEEEAQLIPPPSLPLELSQLTVEVALDEADFNMLAQQNDTFMINHPDITIELRRVDPTHAYSTFKHSSQLGDSADVTLLANEWVREFASSGYLLPADAVFVGTALAEQFDVLAASLKWNGYMWGVPRTMDPFVWVWNSDLLQEWLGAEVALPLTAEQWSLLATKSTEFQGSPSWITLDPSDPLTLFAWLEYVVGERSDSIWAIDSSSWEETPFAQAASLLVEHRTGVAYAESTVKASLLLQNRETVAAILPYSAAASLVAEPQLLAGSKFILDHDTWQLPYVWPRGSSFTISSQTRVEEAAHLWISEITAAPNQLQNLKELGSLPVYRSLYDQVRELSDLLPNRTGNTFPNQAMIAISPKLSEQLEQLGLIWSKYAADELTFTDWNVAWSALVADFQQDD
jgi:ABC-type glycerol-3-phosphate transport system substrate-binding protein